MTDKELEEFIHHGETGFVAVAMMFGEGWAQHAIDIAKELRARLVEPEKEQEPVAYDVQKALYRAYVLGQKYWADADSESYSRNKRADKHRQDFETLCEEALFCTAPPQREWQGLTDEEINTIAATPAAIPGSYVYSFARAIEAKLKEKNG